MRIAVIGAGYVADFYAKTLQNHPQLIVAGVWDRDADRLNKFCAQHSFPKYPSLEAVLADSSVGIVVNLVSAQAHYDISRRALAAGRHVYSEKPLALKLNEAVELVQLAKEKGLFLSSAPANMLGPACRKVTELISAGTIGTPRLAYAEMEDGPVFREEWQKWQSQSGAPWPGWDEFQIGCTLEHAGYALSWLIALFGGVDQVIAHATLISPDKGQPAHQTDLLGRDYSCGSLLFETGMVVRLTCGLIAARDHGLTIFGDLGTITVTDLRDSCSAVYLRRNSDSHDRVARLTALIGRKTGLHIPIGPSLGRRQRLDTLDPATVLPDWPSKIDFAAGIADLEQAITKGGVPPALANDAALHLTEVVLRLDGGGERRGFSSACDNRVVNRIHSKTDRESSDDLLGPA